MRQKVCNQAGICPQARCSCSSDHAPSKKCNKCKVLRFAKCVDAVYVDLSGLTALPVGHLEPK